VTYVNRKAARYVISSTTVPAKHFPACCRYLAKLSKTGDSLASRDQVLTSQTPVRNSSEICSLHGPHRKHRYFIVAFVSVAAGTYLPSCCPETAAARTTVNTVLLLLRALPSNDRCLHSYRLLTCLYATIYFVVRHPVCGTVPPFPNQIQMYSSPHRTVYMRSLSPAIPIGCNVFIAHLMKSQQSPGMGYTVMKSLSQHPNSSEYEYSLSSPAHTDTRGLLVSIIERLLLGCTGFSFNLFLFYTRSLMSTNPTEKLLRTENYANSRLLI
jgi:hypothetical protein